MLVQHQLRNSGIRLSQIRSGAFKVPRPYPLRVYAEV